MRWSRQLIDRWLMTEVRWRATPAFARELAGGARLIKGYSDTQLWRGQGNFLRLMDTVVDPTLQATPGSPDLYANAAAALATARKAALADPEGMRTRYHAGKARAQSAAAHG